MRRFWLLPLALGCLLASSRSDAAPYDFVVIASTAGPFQTLALHPPSLDANGAVAFVGSGSAGSTVQIFVGSQFGCTLDDYVQVSGLQGQPGLGINGVGRMESTQVAFGALASPTTNGVFRGSGGALSTIFIGPGTETEPAVNSTGTLALATGNMLQTVKDEVVTTLLSAGDQLPNGEQLISIRAPDPDIDDEGNVAFFGSYGVQDNTPVCNDRVLLFDGGSVAEVATGGILPNCPFFDLEDALSLNAVGQVAFTGEFLDALQNRIGAVWVDQVVVWNDQLPGFGDSPRPAAVALNDSGVAAFLLDTASGHAGVYLSLGDDPARDKVLAPGDPLCGSTVTDVSFHRFGFNDAGQLALLVTLADRRSLVVRADPSTGQGGQCETSCGKTMWPAPEPEGPLSEVAAALALVMVRRRAA